MKMRMAGEEEGFDIETGSGLTLLIHPINIF